MSVRENIAAGLKAARKRAGYNVDQVGSTIGKSGKTISAWEVGRGQPDGDELIALCKFLDVKLSDLYGSEYSYAVVSFDDSDDGYVNVPIYGEIAAGTPIEMIEFEDEFPIPAKVKKCHPSSGLLRVKGDSWNKNIPNGYLALVDFDMTEPDNDTDPYAVCVNGYSATIKAIEKLENGLKLKPNSYDPTFIPIIYDYNKDDTEEVTIIGKVVWATMPFDYSI